MDTEPLDEPNDPRLDDYRGLRRPDRRAHTRGVTIAEGITVVGRILSSDRASLVRSVVVTPEQRARVAPLASAAGVSVLTVTRAALADVAGFDVHRGVLAALERPGVPRLSDVLHGARTLLVLEGLNDQENLGAILRSARALGVDAVVLDPRCADPFARRVLRVSMGEALFVPIVRTPTWPQALDAIAAAGHEVLALAPSAAMPLSEVQLPADRPVAILAGAEGPGLSAEALACDVLPVRIPMRPGVDSLNVGHAVAIALAHLGRT